MFSTDQFVSTYESYTDEQLFEIHSNLENYSDEAREALNIIINKRGGLDKLIKRMDDKDKISAEIQRIEYETSKFKVQGVDSSFVKKFISSTILPENQVHEIIEKRFAQLQIEEEDKSVKPRTIYGSVIGGIIASILGGGLWGLQLITMQRIMVILLIGLVLLCYGIIRLFTRQSRKNIVVLISTVISVIVSILIGQILFEIIGPTL